MRFKSLLKWSEDPSLDGLKFFAQRLDEMLFDYTIDSYKPPALTSTFLVIETLSLISDIESGVIDYNNLQHVLAELEWSIKNDPIARKLIDADAKYYTAIGNEGELSSLKLRLEVLERSINSKRYTDLLIRDLKEHIKEKEKKAINQLSKSLVSSLINQGVSKQHLYSQVNKSFFTNEVQSLDVMDLFFEDIAPKTHKFKTLLIATDNINDVRASLPAFKLKVLVEPPDFAKDVIKSANFDTTDGECYLIIENDAHDPFSARVKALRSLDTLSDLLSLFLHKSKLRWRDDCIVSRECCGGFTGLVAAACGPMEKAHDMRPEKAAKELHTLVSRFKAAGVSFRKFNRVADLHGMCINHNIVDNQLVNLWTSLETLTPASSNGSKIANVTASVMPFLLITYIDRLVNQFNYDLFHWDRWRAKKILNKVPCDPKTPTVGKALRLLCLKECDELRNQLYTLLKDFHLLRFRAFTLSDALQSRAKVRVLLDEHEKRVEWQIRRIYRTRNLIVHSGKTPPPYIDTLVENGHSYLDTVIFEIMRLSCGNYSVRSLEQAFELARIKHKSLTALLNKDEEHTSGNCDYLIGTPRTILSD